MGRRPPYSQQAARFRKEIRPPSAEDIKQTDIVASAAKALVESLRPLLELNRDRLLRTLQKHEAEAAAIAVISAYIARRVELAAEDSLNDQLTDIPAFAA